MLGLMFLFLWFPILGVVVITWLGTRLFKKTKYSLSISFVFSYFLVSLVLLWYEYQQPPSELFGVPYFMLPDLFSLPLGLLAQLLFRKSLIGYHTRDFLAILAGAIQWGFIFFVYENLKSKGKI